VDKIISRSLGVILPRREHGQARDLKQHIQNLKGIVLKTFWWGSVLSGDTILKLTPTRGMLTILGVQGLLTVRYML